MTVTLTPLAVQPKPSADQRGDERDPRCQTERCTLAATHVRIVAPRPPSMPYREPTAEIVCAVHALLVPAVGDTVADERGNLGVCITHPYRDWSDPYAAVTVEWDTDTIEANVEISTLLFLAGTCTRCGDETVPGQTACGLHGGRVRL